MTSLRTVAKKRRFAQSTPRTLGHRWRVAAIVFFFAALATVVVTGKISANEYAISPGVAKPVSTLLHLPSTKSHPIDGKILYTDVYLTSLSILNSWIDHFRSHVSIVSQQTLLSTDTSANELVVQGYVEMHLAQIAAIEAALGQLGLNVHELTHGALVEAVTPHGPSGKHLVIGEVITQLNGGKISGVCGLVGALNATHPGQVVTLGVSKTTINAKAELVKGKEKIEHVTLGRRPKNLSPATSSGCTSGVATSSGYLGVALTNDVSLTTPFPLHIDTTNVGGPSAGLAMALGIIESLTTGKLSGDKVIAATGTIAPTGAVGPVGGVEQKAVAVSKAKANVFFVPAGEVATARRGASPTLRIVGVKSISQVLSYLAHHGGDVPAALKGSDAPSAS